MTDTTEKTMDDHARDLAHWLEEDVIRLNRLNNLGERADDAAEEFFMELEQRPLAVEAKVTVEVLLYTGGPAGGVTFECERDDYGHLDWLSARVWHQDWFTPKHWWPLDDDTAQSLWDLWGGAYADQ